MKKNNVAIFASGKGSNAKEIITYFENRIPININLVVCNKSKAGVLQIAKAAEIPTLLIDKEKLTQPNIFLQTLKNYKIDWIVLAGFLWKIPEYLVMAYPGHIINIHPALLPKYGGKGMYGANVHKAVIEAREKESGITIHFIDKHYDKGKIILQKKCVIHPEDTPETLAKKVHRLEHQWLPQTVEKVITEAQ